MWLVARARGSAFAAPRVGQAVRQRAAEPLWKAASRRPTSQLAAAPVGSVLGASAKVFGAANLLGFGISCATGSHLHLDLIGTGAFAAAAAFTRITDLRSKLSTAAVGLWATRLASFLLFRATQLGHDVRLDGTLSTVGGAFAFWAVSFVWGWLTALPHTLGAASARRPQLGKGGLLGAVLVVWGLLWEAGADWQKWAFKQDPANGGRFCDVGLWALSQHPNYFGNLCIWSGIFLLNLAPLASVFLKPGDLGPEARGRSVLRSLAGVLLGSLSPLFLAALFHGQATGTITNSLALAQKAYGADPAYRAYVEQVPLIVPNLLLFFKG